MFVLFCLHKQKRRYFHAKMTLHWRSTHGAGHIPLCGIFVIQYATAPKYVVEFCQGSIGTIRSSLATWYNVWQCRVTSPTFDKSEAEKLSHTHRHTHTESTYCQALLYEQRLQKWKEVRTNVWNSISCLWVCRIQCKERLQMDNWII